ncbi:hypothetical protein [Paenibacillus tundrae]|uniref:hypothetical protein n=1 Tax=Paenibacillus tundrae TaxID=528187 RepID=UPI0030D0D1BA
MGSLLWENYNWINEDQEFLPKRRVDNKISWQRPHIIGSFYSRKMKRTVEYHSLNECLFYYYLEVDVFIVRYYVQPIEVPIAYTTKGGERKYWPHVPDVLVFRAGYQPILYQIKESPDYSGEIFNTCNSHCEKMANLKNWKYHIIYPKQLPKIVLSNIQKLQGYLRERKLYSIIRKDVMFNLTLNGPLSIEDLSHCFPPYTSVDIKPFLFHLIATGEVNTNITIPISRHSEIDLKGNATDYSLNKICQSAFGIEQ